MNVAVFGGTGFIGWNVVRFLYAAGHSVRVLVRGGSESKIQSLDGLSVISGDIRDDFAIKVTLDSADAVIYLIGLIREFPRKGITYEEMHHTGMVRVLTHGKSAGIGKFIYMSANGVHPKGTAYQRTKFLAESVLAEGSLDYVIFRPSMVFGDPHGTQEMASQLRDQIVRLPLPAPAFFPGWHLSQAGQFSMTPVHVDDVAAAFVHAVESNQWNGKIIPLGGPEELTWKQLIRRIAKTTGRKKWFVPVPGGLIYFPALLFDRFGWFPITRDQITILLEGNTCDSKRLFEELGRTPKTFDIEHLQYLNKQE